MYEYYALFILISLLNPLNSILLYKRFQQTAGTSLGASILYMVINGIAGAVVPGVLMATQGVPLQLTPYSLVVATALVLAAAVNTIAVFKSYELGQVATINILSTVGTILLSCVWGVLLLDETLSLPGIVALLLMLTAVFLIREKTNEKVQSRLLWLYALAVIGGALTSILSKQHQVETRFATVDTLSLSIWVGIIRATLFSALTPVLILKQGRQALRFPRSATLYAIASSVLSGSTYIITLFTGKVLPIVVTSPLSTGLSILMFTLLPWLFYREKLTRRQLLGAGLSLVGAVLFVLS